MGAQTILIIRHGEKPEPDGDKGVDLNGAHDDKSLTPTGWQRAGAWAQLFVPSLGMASDLPPPATLFASAPETRAEIEADKVGSKSRRPLDTITPLARKLGLEVDLSFEKGQETELANALAAAEGVVLACWQHEDIPAIATAIAPGVPGIPAKWPGDRFNIIFRLDRADASSAWAFQQISPIMLAGDVSTPI